MFDPKNFDPRDQDGEPVEVSNECEPAKHLIVGVPCYKGMIHVEAVAPMNKLEMALAAHGIKVDFAYIKRNSHIPDALNIIVHLAEQAGGTDILFWDYDVGCAVESAVKLALARRPFIGGLYRLKEEDGSIKWPAAFENPADIQFDENGYAEAEVTPGGFLRLNMSVFESLAPYCETYTHRGGLTLREYFRNGPRGGRFWTQDTHICRQWRRLGGKVYIIPDMTFEHIGDTSWVGNWYEWKTTLERQMEERRAAEENAERIDTAA